jgi:hypothetical protein
MRKLRYCDRQARDGVGGIEGLSLGLEKEQTDPRCLHAGSPQRWSQNWNPDPLESQMALERSTVRWWLLDGPPCVSALTQALRTLCWKLQGAGWGQGTQRSLLSGRGLNSRLFPYPTPSTSQFPLLSISTSPTQAPVPPWKTSSPHSSPGLPCTSLPPLLPLSTPGLPLFCTIASAGLRPVENHPCLN